MEGRVNVRFIISGYASVNTGGREPATGGRRGTAYSDQALYTESVRPPRPEQEPRMPLTDPPKRYGTNSGFRLLIGLILVGVFVAWLAL